MNKRIEAAYEQRPRRWVFELAVAVVVVALLIWSGSAVETAGTTQNGAVIAWNILAGIFHPDTDLLFNFTTQGVPYLLLETICIAFLGTIVGAIISVPLAFLSASNLTPKPVAFVGRIIIMAVRTVPAFVYGLMFIRVTGPGAFAGLLTMSLCSVGMVSKMYIEAIEDLDVRVLESLDAAGCTTWQKIRYGILPQLMPNFASTAIYRFDINLRDATVLGLVGAGGIGAPLIFAMNSYRWEEAGAILAGLIVLVLIVQFYVSGMRQINLQFREAMGLFWHDRYKAVAEAIINLVTSLILVQRHGVTGVFLGTIISTMTTCFWVEPYVLMKYGIKTDWQSKLKTYFADYGRRTATVLVGGLLGYGLFARHIDTVMMFILKGAGFTMVYGALVLAVFGRTAEFRALFEQGKRIIGRKMSKGK